MAEKMLIPAIRFKKFTEEWEENELDSLFSKIKNAFVGTSTPYYVDQGHFYLESNNVKNGQINRNSEIFINDFFYKKQEDNWLHTDDIVMVQSGHVGHSAVIPVELNNIAAHALIIFADKKKQVCSYFLNYQFQTDISKAQIGNITTGNTIKHILSSEMKKFKVLLPQVTQQTQIGGYFQNLDKLISLHQAEYNKLANLKKAMLEKMFPKSGADVPEIRFKGFEEAWDEKAVGEIFDDFKGTGLSKEKIGSHGKNKCILYGHLFTKFSEVISQIDSRTDFNEGVVSKKNDILMPSSTTTKGIDLAKASSLKESGVLLGGDIIILRMKELGSSDFFAYYLTHGVNKKIAEVTQGTTIIHLYFSGLKDVHIKVPCPAEQTQIGTYFQNLDKLVNLHQTELDKLDNLKKACLEKMFA